MKNLKEEFIKFSVEHNVLQFGDFVLKSGRRSPYFFNLGLFNDGPALRILGQFYAASYQANGVEAPHLFGPAYKGILLATITSLALAEIGFCTTVTFNRKEAKSHGEKGMLVGAALNGPTTIIDDVITAGTAYREAKHLIEMHGGEVKQVIIALDRCEKGLDQRSTLDEIKAQGIQVHSIINVFDIVHYLRKHHQLGLAEKIENHLQHQ